MSLCWHVPVLPTQSDPDGMRRQWPERRPVCLPDWQQLSARGSLSSNSHSSSSSNNNHAASRRLYAVDHTQHKPICSHFISGTRAPFSGDFGWEKKWQVIVNAHEVIKICHKGPKQNDWGTNTFYRNLRSEKKVRWDRPMWHMVKHASNN